MPKFFSLIILCLFSYIAVAQPIGNLDENLAAQYYQNGEYDKAAVLYKKLLDQNPANNYFYENYLNSLIFLKDYSTAEKELKKLIKKNDNSLLFKIDLGHIYTLQGDEKASKNIYDDILKRMRPTEESVHQTASSFLRRERFDYAIATYEQGRKLSSTNDMFASELAALYGRKGDFNKMIEEYLRILDGNPFAFMEVRDELQEVLSKDEPYDMMRKLLLKRAQTQPDNPVYSEMLTWLFIQRKDFNAAFIQAKAYDKRVNEGGKQLVDLAKIVIDHGDLNLAEKIYQAVLELGIKAPYYMIAQRGMLDIRYARITQTADYTTEDISKLIADYNQFINNYTMMRPEAGEVVLKLAEIEALYNGKVAEAIELLTKFVAIPGIEKSLSARAKLALGDYYILNGQDWDAMLFYGQVEKMYKDNPLGHEAKFRNARLSFYRAEFDWATAQLEVLKGSTSELISNDALQLSMLIQDNSGLDTSTDALKLFADADFLIFKNQFATAQLKLDSLEKQFPGHSLADDVLMARAQIAMKKRDYQTAYNYYEQVFTRYGTDILGDDALIKAAQLQDKFIHNEEKAKELYEKLILEYSGSVYAVEARQRYRQLRGEKL